MATKKTPRNPFRGFLDVMSEMNRMQHQWMQRDPSPSGRAREHTGAWVPPADIYALSGDLVIRCELAGLKREDVDVSVYSGVLTISGNRRSDLDDKQVSFYTRERASGEFQRSMILPENVDRSDISATLNNGLLEVTVKKGATAKPQSVDILSSDD